MVMPKSTLRHRSVGTGEHVQVLTPRASRPPVTMTKPGQFPSVAVQTEDSEAEKRAIQTDDLEDSFEEEESAYHTVVPVRSRNRSIQTRISTRQVPAVQKHQPMRQWRIPSMRPLFWIAIGVLLLWLVYTGIWGIKLGMGHWNNALRFQGHPPVDSLTAMIDGQSTNIFARNTGQEISVYLFLAGGKVQILSEPLYPSAWAEDTAEVVPSLSVDHGKLILTLTGDPQYGGLMGAVTEKFVIAPMATGYQINRIA